MSRLAPYEFLNPMESRLVDYGPQCEDSARPPEAYEWELSRLRPAQRPCEVRRRRSPNECSEYLQALVPPDHDPGEKNECYSHRVLGKPGRRRNRVESKRQFRP